MAKISFRAQVLLAREEAILQAVLRLLADKGYELMTVDEVAAEAGIAKASLYKHFASKELLAAAAMVQVLDRALTHLETLPATAPAIDQLRAVARWTLEVQLAGDMPSLPSQNSQLRATLATHAPYMERLNRLSEHLGAWIIAAQAQGSIDAELPPQLVLYTLFARACDPVLGVLKAEGAHNDERIIELLLRTCFQGLGAATPTMPRL